MSRNSRMSSRWNIGTELRVLTGGKLTPNSGTQASAIADAAAPAAVSSSAITGGESPTEAEHNAVRADVVALRAEVATLTTKLNAALAALRGVGVIAT